MRSAASRFRYIAILWEGRYWAGFPAEPKSPAWLTEGSARPVERERVLVDWAGGQPCERVDAKSKQVPLLFPAQLHAELTSFLRRKHI